MQTQPGKTIRFFAKTTLLLVILALAGLCAACGQSGGSEDLKQTMMALAVQQTVQANIAAKTQDAIAQNQQATFVALSIQATVLAAQPTPMPPAPAPVQAVPAAPAAPAAPPPSATPEPAAAAPTPAPVYEPLAKGVITGVQMSYCTDTSGTVQVWWKPDPAAVRYRICIKRGQAAGNYDKCSVDKLVDDAQPDPYRRNDLTYKFSLGCRTALAVSVRGVDANGFEGEWAVDWTPSVPTPAKPKKTPTPFFFK